MMLKFKYEISLIELKSWIIRLCEKMLYPANANLSIIINQNENKLRNLLNYNDDADYDNDQDLQAAINRAYAFVQDAYNTAQSHRDFTQKLMHELGRYRVFSWNHNSFNQRIRQYIRKKVAPRIYTNTPSLVEMLQDNAIIRLAKAKAFHSTNFVFSFQSIQCLNIVENILRAIAKLDKVAVCRLLTSNKSLLLVRNTNAQNLLHLLFLATPDSVQDFESKQTFLLNLFIRKFAINSIDIETLINQQDSMGCTPLHYAARTATQESLSQLLALNPDLSIKNLKDETISDCTANLERKELLRARCPVQISPLRAF